MQDKTVNLNLDQAAPPALIRATQGDTMWRWHFPVFLDGLRWTIPTGAQALLKGAKPDGHVFAYAGSIANNEVVVDCALQMTACAGPVGCTLVILDGDGKRLHVARIVLLVAADPEPAADVASDSALPAYAEVLADISELLELASTLPDDLPGYMTQAAEAWLDEHIDPSTGYVIDDTLTVSGAAADAAATGAAVGKAQGLAAVIRQDNLEYFADMPGQYVKANGDVGALGVLRCSDFIAVPNNVEKLQLYAYYTNNNSQKSTFTPLAVLYNASKTVIGTVPPTGHVNGVKTSVISENVKFIRINQSNQPVDKADCLARFVYGSSESDRTLGTAGSYSGTFTAAEQVLQTGVDLQAGKTYVVRSTAPLEEAVSLYAVGDAAHAVTLTPSADAVRLTPAASAPLCVTNPDGGLFSVALTVSAFASIADKTGEVPKIYRVNKTAGAGDYTSLTQCLLDLKDDRTPKTIFIDGGDYDIFEEYQNADVPVYTGSNPALEYWDYNVWIPDNTHIIGRGIVRLMWMPDPAEHPELTTVQCQAVSPVNVAGSMTLENVEIHCKNGRYCIHDDPLGKTQYSGAVKIYRNVRCYHYANDRKDGVAYGFAPTIGMGLDKQMHYVFEDCYFWNGGQSYAFYCHSRQTVDGQRLTEAESSDLTLKNCVCKTARAEAVKLGNSGSPTNLRIRVGIFGCSISGSIDIINESGTGTPNPNAFDLLLARCNTVTVNVADESNPYPPQIFD